MAPYAGPVAAIVWLPMEHQLDAAWAPAAAYEAVWAPRPESKVDNRAYAIASLGFWAQVVRSEPTPAFDPQVVPYQPVPEALAVGYLDLLG